MRIIDLLKPVGIELNSSVTTKNEAIDRLVNLQEQSGNVNDVEAYKWAILARESQGCTAIGEGIAIPHCKSDAVKSAGLAAITVPNGVDYGAPDGKPSNLIFMIAATNDGDAHLEVLSRLTVLLMNEDFRKELLAAESKDEFLKIIDKYETEKYGNEGLNIPDAQSGYRVLAVTACPTGIAHTFMAAEALEKKAAEMNVTIKVETNGSGGAKNVLTSKEIAECDAVIIAADKNVDTARFNGKPVLFTKVSNGINKPQELIEKALSGNVPVYHHSGEVKSADDSGEKESIGRQIYKHLMNGVSHMLPFVIGGGIMIAIAFLIDTIAGAPADATFGTHTAAASFFKNIGGVAFNFMLPVLAGFIAMSIADRPGLAVGFVGGSIATLGCTFASPAGDSAAVSGFLGALIAGFVGGYIVVLLKKAASVLPKSLEGIKPVFIYPLFGTILIGAFMCLINPAVGWLNSALNNGLASMGSGSMILLGAVLAGMMAIDMGGPFNKAAYVFGTGMLASATAASYEIMAAVMIGGMVPPIAIALCATFFKRKFTPDQRKSALVNYAMGLCFITEGAIPFAAADPLRVIPSCVVGSAAAGALSALFGCQLRAPHGGVFVFPVVENVLGYIVALAIGAVISMIMLALLKKNVSEK